MPIRFASGRGGDGGGSAGALVNLEDMSNSDEGIQIGLAEANASWLFHARPYQAVVYAHADLHEDGDTTDFLRLTFTASGTDEQAGDSGNLWTVTYAHDTTVTNVVVGVNANQRIIAITINPNTHTLATVVSRIASVLSGGEVSTSYGGNFGANTLANTINAGTYQFEGGADAIGLSARIDRPNKGFYLYYDPSTDLPPAVVNTVNAVTGASAYIIGGTSPADQLESPGMNGFDRAFTGAAGGEPDITARTDAEIQALIDATTITTFPGTLADAQIPDAIMRDAELTSTAIINLITGVVGFSDLAGMIGDSQIPDAIMRDSEFTTNAVIALVTGQISFSDLAGIAADGQIPDEIMRDAELTSTAVINVISGVISFSDLTGMIDDGQIPAAIMRDAEFTATAVQGLLNLTPTEVDSILTGATLAGQVLTFTQNETGPISLTLPAGGMGGGTADGVVQSGAFNATGTELTLTLSTGSTVVIDVPAVLRATGGTADGVLQSGVFNAAGTELTLTLSTGGTVVIDVPAILRTAGAADGRVRFGTTAPNNNDGIDGDSYLEVRTEVAVWYEKVGGVWTERVQVERAVAVAGTHLRYFGWSVDRVIETADFANATASMTDSGELPDRTGLGYIWFGLPAANDDPTSLEFEGNTDNQIFFFEKLAGTVDDANAEAHEIWVSYAQQADTLAETTITLGFG